MSAPDWTHHAARALTEDCATHDITTALLGAGREQPAVGRIRAECDFVVAGLPLVDAVFRELEPSVAVERLVDEGSSVKAGETLAVVRGSAATLLAGERVALNYLQRLCGVATVTRRAVNAIAGTASVITDTRKTTPGLRELEKYAVRIGGGENHRASLADAVLWKDNHWELLRSLGGDLSTVLRDVPDGAAVCVEVESGEQLAIALAAGVKWILADNQPPDVIQDWVTRCGPDVTLEASGGITPETAVDYANAGARRISMGVLTYAPDPASVSFEIGRPESTGDHRG